MSRSSRLSAGMLTTASLALLLFAPSAALAANGSASCTVPIPAATSVAPVAADSALAVDLSFMREEEKLAHDVYTVLAAKWGTRIFTNIAASEQRHTDAIKTLLDRYGIADPAAGKAIGVFADPKLQQLYTDLVARGSKSQTEALAVGKVIEQVDIADLDARIGRTTQADVLAVYKNLRAAWVKHLAAFSGQGSRAGRAGRAGARGTGRRGR